MPPPKAPLFSKFALKYLYKSVFHGQRRTVFFICVKVLNLHLITFFLNENSIQVKAGVTAAEGSHHVETAGVGGIEDISAR